jgi:hypothetical protein
MLSLHHQQLEVETERRACIQTFPTILIQRINYRLLHLSEILQPLWATKHDVVLVDVVHLVLK